MNEVDRVKLIAAASGISARKVTMLPGGKQNFVARVQGGADDVVVRFARDPSQVVDPFDIEVWALRAAAAAGIHTSAVVARGRVADTSYLVMEYIAGTTASPSDLGAWRAVGVWLRLSPRSIRQPPRPSSSRGSDVISMPRGAHMWLTISRSSRRMTRCFSSAYMREAIRTPFAPCFRRT